MLIISGKKQVFFSNFAALGSDTNTNCLPHQRIRVQILVFSLL